MSAPDRGRVSSVGHGAIELMLRLRSAGATNGRVSATDARTLGAAIDKAMSGNGDVTLESALGLNTGWKAAARHRLALSEGYDLRPELSAREVHDVLERYVATHFASDLAAGTRPSSERETLFLMVLTHGGKAPGIRTIQRDRAAYRRVTKGGCFDAADGSRMAKGSSAGKTKNR